MFSLGPAFGRISHGSNDWGTTYLTRIGNFERHFMTKMKILDTAFRHPLDTTERASILLLIIAAIAVATVVAGGVTFYSYSHTPAAIATTDYSPIVDSFKALEVSRPAPRSPSTTGQGGAQYSCLRR